MKKSYREILKVLDIIPKVFGITRTDYYVKNKNMKLVIVTVVEEFHKEVIKLFKNAGIESFSESDIDGYKNGSSLLMASNWFSGPKGGNESNMFFSFTEEEKIDALFNLIKEFNNNLETNNPIKAIVVPIEKFI